MIKILIGLLILIAGLVFGIYVGVWLCFVGGILGLIEVANGLIDGNGLDGMLTAWSILKMMFASLAGYLSFSLAYVLAMPLLTDYKKPQKDRKRKRFY